MYAVQLPGRGTRSGHPSITDPRNLIPSLADLLPIQDPRPFALFGHSVGALLAFETARQLRRTQRRIPDLLALSALPAPHLDAIASNVSAYLLGGVDGLTTLLGPIPHELLADPSRLAAYTPVLADVLLALQHHHHDEAPLDTTLALYRGDADPIAPLDQLAAWNDLVTVPANPHLFPGGHQYPLEQTPALLQRLTKDLHATTRSAFPAP
ncbi:thioesterase II family protein [Streptomyces sp. NPDC020799]|uniref:thioesterase II family protein n=1 Tax=Streptomyces sp. NPDC020799 TaxID=3365091 RepID=UPI0037B9441B